MAGLSGDEYAKLKGRLSDLVAHLEDKRESAKAAATHYPSKAATVLGEADAYDDAADEVRELLAALPK
jgi:hypothetical protein